MIDVNLVCDNCETTFCCCSINIDNTRDSARTNGWARVILYTDILDICPECADRMMKQLMGVGR